MRQAPAAVLELKRLLAETLVRSKLDYTDDILILNAFLWDFRWEEGHSARRLKRRWEALGRRKPAPGHSYSVYAHIPYCAKKCHFCYCATEISTNRAVLDGYVPQLRREIDFFAPALAGRRIPLFQLGGGTPSILSAAQLRELLSGLQASFTASEDCLRVAEFNPASTDRAKLALLREFGFDRISFGVQSLSSRVLEGENREYQTGEMTARAVTWARELGFPIINVDLMLGLEGETRESFLSGFETIARLRPTMIVVPGLTLTDAYIKVKGISREANQRRYEALLPGALEGMRRLCERYGYETDALTPNQGIWVTYLKDAPQGVLEKMRRHDHFSGGNMSVLGLGHHARSWLFGEAVATHYPESFAPDKPLYRLVPFSPRQEMMRYLLYSIENFSRVEFARFAQRFGADVREEFELELKALAALGQITPDGSGFSFLPVRGTERIFYGLFFLRELLAESPYSMGRLDAGLNRRLRRELSPVSLEELCAA